MIWFIARTNGKIAAAFSYEQPGYAEEALDDTVSAELQAFLVPPVPQSVTNTQLKRQLDAMGKLSAAQAAVTQAGGLTLELWYGAGTFNRDDPLLTAMATAIGMSSADVDAAFVAAAKL